MSDLKRIVERLPHGPQARMVSRVRALGSDRIETEMHWSRNDPRIADHFPSGLILVPGIYLAEQAAQSALLLSLIEHGSAPGELFVLGHLRCDFVQPALAPCTVVARVILIGRVKGSVGFKAECLNGEKVLARIKGGAFPAPLGYALPMD